MDDKEIIEIKESAAIVAHLSFLQQIISRMASNSSNCKILIAMIITVITTLLISFGNYHKFWWVSIIIILYGLIADAYYLGYERIFRKQYNVFIEKINNKTLDEKDIYRIKPTNNNCEGELFFTSIKCITSFSIWIYYISLIIICYILK